MRPVPPVAHAADWFMAIPGAVFLVWLVTLNVRDRLARRKEPNDAEPDKS